MSRGSQFVKRLLRRFKKRQRVPQDPVFLEHAIVKVFLTMFICFSVGVFFVMFDLASVPVKNRDYYREHPDFRVTDREFPSSSWFVRIGDGIVTALENIIMTVSLLFGALRTVDLLFLWDEYERSMAAAWFFSQADMINGDVE